MKSLQIIHKNKSVSYLHSLESPYRTHIAVLVRSAGRTPPKLIQIDAEVMTSATKVCARDAVAEILKVEEFKLIRPFIIQKALDSVVVDGITPTQAVFMAVAFCRCWVDHNPIQSFKILQ